MMLEKISLVDLQATLQEMLKKNTGMDVYDAPPEDAPSPLLYVELTGIRDASTKTSWREGYTYWIHAVAKPGKSSVEVLDIIRSVETAMTETLQLPDGYDHHATNRAGMVSSQTDSTGEKHAVIAYEIVVTYGFKCKV